MEPSTEPSVAALAIRESPDALVRPAASLTEIKDAFLAYQALARELLDASDFQTIAGKKFRKRSAWRKLAVAFGVTFEIIDREVHRDPSGRILRAEFVVRATAPNGRFSDGWGNCDVFERCCPPECSKGGSHKHCLGAQGYQAHEDSWTHFSHAEHDIPATSETRSKNRAAADLFGMGEVSAEEMVGVEDAVRGQRPRRAQAEKVEEKPPTDSDSVTQTQKNKIRKLGHELELDQKDLEAEINSQKSALAAEETIDNLTRALNAKQAKLTIRTGGERL